MSALIGSLVLIGIAIWGGFHLFVKKKKNGGWSLGSDLECPICVGSLTIEEMLDASLFFAPGAIVFDCPHCRARAYFSPYEDFLEIGTLGAAPVVDAIPKERFGYPANFDMTSKIESDILIVNIGRKFWRIRKTGIRSE